MYNKPLIFDIHRCSMVDGPGLRTTVFFKGCSLNCFWCHNPEGISTIEQTAFFSEKCIGCGTCGGEPCFDRCPSQAWKKYGDEMTLQQLMDIIIRDSAYYTAGGGGVTFSGGECMLYPEFLSEIAAKCKQNGIHVAVDTAGYVPWKNFEMVLPYVDLFLYDIKCLNDEIHIKGTGRSNRCILDNLNQLLKTDKEVIVRTPLIPGFNDGEEAKRIKSYCAERSLCWEGLEYHSFGESKRIALNNRQ